MKNSIMCLIIILMTSVWAKAERNFKFNDDTITMNIKVAANTSECLKAKPGPPLGINTSKPADIKFSVYPNPANNYINIHFSQQICTDYRYSIRSVDGKEMLSGNISGSKLSTQTISIYSLKKGMYFIEIISDNKITNFMFVKN